MTLEALLTLVEQLQLGAYEPLAHDAIGLLRNFPVAQLRVAAQQHAAQLREEAEDGDAGEGVSSTVLRAAAEFLQPSGAQEQT